MSTFIEPVSHTILYSLLKAWLDLICHTSNGIFVQGKKFVLQGGKDGILDSINDAIDSIQLSSAYNRGALSLVPAADGCASASSAVLPWSMSVASRKLGSGEHILNSCRGVGVTRWYFEELATFVEVTGAYAFWTVKDDPRTPPRLIEMWTHLRAYAMYFLFYQPGQHTIDQIRAAQNHLFKFAEFAEEEMEGRMCGLLLHRASVHLPEQVIDAGPSPYMREDFGERGIRVCKHKITHAATKDAAQASAACCVLEMCMRSHKRKCPDVDAPAIKRQATKRVRRSDSGGSDGVQLHQLAEAYNGTDNDEVCACCPAIESFCQTCAGSYEQVSICLLVQARCRSVDWLSLWMTWRRGWPGELTACWGDRPSQDGS